MMYLISLAFLISSAASCSDFLMNFTDPKLQLSVRTMDLGGGFNWTITSWPVNERTESDVVDWDPTYASFGITANWFGDDKYGFPSFFADSLNEKGLSCGFLALVGTGYAAQSDTKENVFAGVFCHWAAQKFADVYEVQAALENTVIWGPDALAQHFILRDASGTGLVVECIGGVQHVYLDTNDGENSFGIATNEPTFDYHLMNIKHYQWKRTLARQAVAIPGNFYPEERYLRVHMVKGGMQSLMEETTDYQTAISLAAQVMNTVTVPMGMDQYGTDSGETSGEGEGDHTMWGLIRDHSSSTIYWRDASNPSFRSLKLSDVLSTVKGAKKPLHLPVNMGAFHTSMIHEMQ